MKRKSILILLFAVSLQAQSNKESYQYVSFGTDVRNLAVGSQPTNNKSALDFIFNAGLVGRNLEVNISYENFAKINFDKYAFEVGYHFPLYANVFSQEVKTVLITSIAPSLIGRWGNWGGGLGDRTQVSSHLSLGVGLGLRWALNEFAMIEIKTDYLPRVDLNAMYGGDNYRFSEYLKLICRL